ncbi:transposase [Streptomyces neyagawaensis]|uniref:transposase n=1 Tax=Streptomyces neyagawaensis TaxID=42238 RepID=UPI0035575AD6
MGPVETRKTTARPWEIDDGLWARIEPLLPVIPRNLRRPGRKRLDSRQVLCGILFVLYTGIRREYLPQELAFESGTWLARAAGLERDRGLAVPARAAALRAAGRRPARLLPRRGRLRPHPRDEGRIGHWSVPRGPGKVGSKHHLLVEAHGIPRAAITTVRNRNDVT